MAVSVLELEERGCNASCFPGALAAVHPSRSPSRQGGPSCFSSPSSYTNASCCLVMPRDRYGQGCRRCWDLLLAFPHTARASLCVRIVDGFLMLTEYAWLHFPSVEKFGPCNPPATPHSVWLHDVPERWHFLDWKPADVGSDFHLSTCECDVFSPAAFS